MRLLGALLLLAACSDNLSEVRSHAAYLEERWNWRQKELERQAAGLEEVLGQAETANDAYRVQALGASRAVKAMAASLADAHVKVKATLARGRRTEANLALAELERTVDTAFVRTENNLNAALTATRELPAEGNTDDLVVSLAQVGNGTELELQFDRSAALKVEESRDDLAELERWARFCRGRGELELVALIPGSAEEVAAEQKAAVNEAVDRMQGQRPRRRRLVDALLASKRQRVPIVRTGPTESRRDLARARLRSVIEHLQWTGVPTSVFTRVEVEFDETAGPSIWVAVTKPCAP